MQAHKRKESRFHDAPSQSSLRRHARKPSQPSITSCPTAPPVPPINHPGSKTNLGLPSQKALLELQGNKSSTSSKHSSRSALKSSRRGSLQNRPGLALETWQKYAEKGPAPLPCLKDNPYGVYTSNTTRESDGTFRASGYGAGIPVAQPVQWKATNFTSSTNSSNDQRSSRFSRFEDALDVGRPSFESSSVMNNRGHNYRQSQFEDASDFHDMGRPESVVQPTTSISQSLVRPPAESAAPHREKSILAELLSGPPGPTRRSEKPAAVIRRDTDSSIISSGGKLRDVATHDQRRQSGLWTETKSRPLMYQDLKKAAANDQASIRTNNTFGLMDDVSSVKTVQTTKTFGAFTYQNEAGDRSHASARDTSSASLSKSVLDSGAAAKRRKSLVGIFPKVSGSGKSSKTTKLQQHRADTSVAESDRLSRQGHHSRSTTQTPDHGRQDSRDTSDSRTVSFVGKVQIVGSIKDAFPVVRESIELDASRGLMPAFQKDHSRSQKTSVSTSCLNDVLPKTSGFAQSTRSNGLPSSAFHRGMTPEPFLEHGTSKKTSASPLLTKVRSAWNLSGHQTSQSSDLVVAEEVLNDKEEVHQPASGLARIKSNLSLSRFKSHKASLADIQANALAQGNTTSENSWSYVDDGAGDRSTISEWTLASVSTLSDGLAAPWEEGGRQGGGKVVRKKKSIVSGALLGKVFGGLSSNKNKKEKRQSKGECLSCTRSVLCCLALTDFFVCLYRSVQSQERCISIDPATQIEQP